MTLVRGLTAAVVGASDPEPHLRLWRDALGYDVVAQGRIDAATATVLYGLDGDVDAWGLAAPGTDSGLVHLLHLPDAPAVGAAAPTMSRTGLHGLDLYARDLDDAATAMAGVGIGWRMAPQTYDVPLGEQTVTVTEGSFLGPDGTQVVLVRPGTPRGTQAWEDGPTTPFTELTSLVATVADVEAEIGFWAALGMSQLYDVTFTSDAVAELAGLPAGTPVRITFMVGPTTARVEIFGVPDGPLQVVPGPTIGRDLGHSGWSVRTADLDAVLVRLRRTAHDVGSDVVDVTTPLHGTARIARVRTPGGVHVELWQPA